MFLFFCCFFKTKVSNLNDLSLNSLNVTTNKEKRGKQEDSLAVTET